MDVGDAWAAECGNCGWTVFQRELPAGMRLEEALDVHRRKACVPAWMRPVAQVRAD